MLHCYRLFRLCSFITLGYISHFSYAGDNQPQQNQSAAKVEVIAVIGKKHQQTSAPTAKAQIIDSENFRPNVANLSELVADTPGAELSGQGGLFQVYSLRGMSRGRVLTQLSGVPIHTERRAGSAASFISPWLIGQVEVLKGPVSTLYGSGGMAGITQLTPRQFDGTEVNVALGNGNHSNSQNFGWGDGQYSVALSHRKDRNSQTPDRQPLNSHFEQTSGSFVANSRIGSHIDSQFLLLSSVADDIGKTNNEDFQHSQYTVYPNEQHHLAQLSLSSDSDWQADFAVHRQQLSTQVTRFNQRINRVDNQSTDHSLNFLQRWQAQQTTGQWGLEQQYRDNITADEQEHSLIDGQRFDYQLLAASQYNGALFANINTEFNRWSLSSGGRLSYIRQQSKLSGQSPVSDRAVSAFASAGYALSAQWQVYASASSGFRFPSVTERYFNGTTARGTTLGRLDLSPERARNLELGISYSHNNRLFEFNGFNNRIKDYIERINIDADTRSYQNLERGTIKGIELSFSSQFDASFSYRLSGHHLTGTDRHGTPLSDVSPNKLQLNLDYRQQQWQAGLSIKHRFAQSQVAPGDQPLEAVNIVKASFSYDLSVQWQLSLWADNLLNRNYLLTADGKSSHAAERQWGIKLSWRNE